MAVAEKDVGKEFSADSALRQFLRRALGYSVGSGKSYHPHQAVKPSASFPL